MARKSRKNLDTITVVEPMPMFYNAAAYLRLSSDDRKKRGDSLETQRNIIENYIATSPDMRLTEVYTDNNATGTNFDRPGFKKMLADLECGKINCIVVKDLTRFGRNAVDAGYYLERHFPTLGVRFIAVTDNYDSNDVDDEKNPCGGIMIPFKNVIAESYALDISRKCRAVQRQNIRDGRFVGRLAPYGYAKSPDDCHKLIIDEETAPVVRRIFDWASCGVTTGEIAIRLNELGVLPPSHRNHARGHNTSDKLLGGLYWHVNAIKNILTDRVNIGDMVQGKTRTEYGKKIVVDPSEWVCVTNTHEPIISRELFDRVQALRQQLHEQAKTYNDFGPYSPNIFKGKIFCSRCGHPMRRKRQNKDGIYLFYCNTRERFGKGTCVQVSIKEVALNAEILSTLIERPGIIHRNIIKSEVAAKQGAQATIDARLRDVNKGLDRDGRLLRSLYESLVTGLLTQAEYTRMKSDYSAKIEALSRLADEIRSRGYESKARAEQHSDFAGGIFDAISTHELTVEIMDILVENIHVNPDKSFHVAFSIKDELGEVLLCG